jgi:serine/threonine-protein kinase
MGIPGVQTQARLGRYELLARLATGGMGEIFLARLEGAAGFEKLYVVKRILPHLADDARFRQMLIAEARIASKLSHANICQVYELGETDGQLYIVMEYLEGVTLLPLLRRAGKSGMPLELGLVAGIVQQSCDALHYAHELRDRGETLGLVHRDVTPSNIFLTESGIAKVLDFGIAKAKGASTQTQEGTVKGKYAYMAPEQLRGSDIDRRVDIFALGIVVFEMLALRRLFQRKTDYLTFRAVMEQPIPDIRRYRADAPESLAFVLARALDRDPENRFETARQLGTAVLDAIGPSRPWSQGEISDFVRGNFDADLAKRSNAVQSAIHRTAGGGPIGRATMPLIVSHEPDQHEHDDDVDFPSVETDVDVSPPFTPPQPMPRAPSHPAEFIEGTPPPFAAETTGSGPRMVPVRGSPIAPPGSGTAPVMVIPHRSVVWPLVAVGMLGIAGVALYLVYQMSNRQQAPSNIVIQEQHDKTPPPPTPPPVDPAPTETPAPPPDPGPTGSAKEPRKPPPAIHHAVNPYGAAIEGHLNQLSACISAHPDSGIPTTLVAATITVGTDGRAKAVGWKPDALDASPLGACLKNAIKTLQFPRDTKDITFTWTTGFTKAK